VAKSVVSALNQLPRPSTTAWLRGLSHDNKHQTKQQSTLLSVSFGRCKITCRYFLCRWLHVSSTLLSVSQSVSTLSYNKTRTSPLFAQLHLP